jgi:exodeoxyribonuclease V alpha subunit
VALLGNRGVSAELCQSTQPYTMLARNLVYTGVTRGKRLVVVIGQRKALGIAVRGGQMKSRWTKLKEWLTG